MARPFIPRYDYTSAPTVAEYIADPSFVSGITGPVGSGKSHGSCARAGATAMDQDPDPRDDMRRARIGVFRNTYGELETTTIPTFLEVWPEGTCGILNWSHPISYRMTLPKRRGQPGLEAEFVFMAMDKPRDIRHLKSLDLTAAFINEACEVPFEVINMLTSRVGRFPPRRAADNFVGASRVCIMADTNADDSEGWWYKASELNQQPKLQITLNDEVIDLTWNFHKQPPAVVEVREISINKFACCEPGFEGFPVDPRTIIPAAGKLWTLNPFAENVANLRSGYYHQQLANKPLEWIQRYLQAKYVLAIDGRPWVPEYDDNAMSARVPYDPSLELHAGIDIGGGTLNPSAVWLQRGQFRDVRVVGELCLFDCDLNEFTSAFIAKQQELFPNARLARAHLDPSSRTRDPIYKTSITQHLIARGLPAIEAPTNDPIARRDAIASCCTRILRIQSRAVPGLLVDRERCPMLRQALAGRWHRRRLALAGERYRDAPDKGKWSHVGDALGYGCLGIGEFHTLLQGGHNLSSRQQQWNQAKQGGYSAKTDFSVFGDSDPG